MMKMISKVVIKQDKWEIFIDIELKDIIIITL